MEPIKINIEVEVGLKQTTIDTIRQLFGAQITYTKDSVPEAEAPNDEPKRKAKKAEPAPESEPVMMGADPIGTGAEDVDDLPPDDAPAPKKTPTEDDARQAVKAARSRGVTAKVIKDLMRKSFGIESSVECPAEKRQELIDELNKLAA